MDAKAVSVGQWVGALLVAALLGGEAAADDWSYWRGPTQDGVCYETNLIDDWSLEEKKNVVWTSEIGGRATPVIQNGRVYLNCRTNDDVADPVEKIHSREQVICWDLKTGEVLWKDIFNVFQTDIPAPRVGWASMTGDPETGNVYVHSVSGVFRCYDRDGKVLWGTSLFEEYGKISGYGGRTTTPIIDEDRIIVSFLAVNWGASKGPAPAHYFYAFDKKDGRLLWTTPLPGRPKDTIYTNPMIRVIDGVRQLVTGGADGGVHGIHARTGEYLWGYSMSLRGLNASPVIEGERVYISHGEDNLDTVDFGSVRCIDPTKRGDITESGTIWRVDGVKAGYTGLLIKDGVLYVVSDVGILHAFDAESGKELWQHTLGTVGKGSPVWADGKIYVMEVNGNVHILEVDREGCKSLSHVELDAADGNGTDEIYASPAIADGKVVLVTRDRTICLGNPETEPASTPIPKMAEEAEPTGEPTLLQLVPFETRLWAGESVTYELRAFDKNGRLIETTSPEITVDPAEKLAVDGAAVIVADDLDAALATEAITATRGELKATARLRAFPKLPWSWDFNALKGKAVPPAWVNAFVKLTPAEVDGEQAMVNRPGPGKPSVYIWLGPADMEGYTVQADVRAEEVRRQLGNVGVTCQRYNLILVGNTSKLQIVSWAPHLRMAQTKRFRWDPDKWYTMKLTVEIQEDGAHVLGKVWERGKEEPAEWTIEAVDPHPNTEGSPGLYTYRLAPVYFDNVSVTKP